ILILPQLVSPVLISVPYLRISILPRPRLPPLPSLSQSFLYPHPPAKKKFFFNLIWDIFTSRDSVGAGSFSPGTSRADLSLDDPKDWLSRQVSETQMLGPHLLPFRILGSLGSQLSLSGKRGVCTPSARPRGTSRR
ncbi:mCG145494, isoform CRA_a, partial [Mus musculus]